MVEFLNSLMVVAHSTTLTLLALGKVPTLIIHGGM